ncbi:hypothetical protein PoB_001865500 [Plakobranchus ocellatus]|uniref:Uncharacterized protein n=1 Tax=Plakobranchus ocellatus TaxID=259542 RepID=A0AAV3Z9E4_9GAST|nr:hypothetical protein PoB_001865500 [Plakobranchus ocellatus]
MQKEKQQFNSFFIRSSTRLFASDVGFLCADDIIEESYLYKPWILSHPTEVAPQARVPILFWGISVRANCMGGRPTDTMVVVFASSKKSSQLEAMARPSLTNLLTAVKLRENASDATSLLAYLRL